MRVARVTTLDSSGLDCSTATLASLAPLATIAATPAASRPSVLGRWGG